MATIRFCSASGGTGIETLFSEFEAAGRLIGEPSLGLFGNVRGMIVEDQFDRCGFRAKPPTVPR